MRKSSLHQAGDKRPLTNEQIAALAYELWQERGRPEGSDIDIWLDAERQLRDGASHPVERDPIPADPDHPDADSDPAINPATDQEIRSIGGSDNTRSPTSFDVDNNLGTHE
ncbi:MAG TPA: DUF2934 domain-containing protein [Opitutaceae bacterium]|nr:DUF2934 domain-containing protein [Opitutaceae bacterium]